MSAPTPKVRQDTYRRDCWHCLRCGRTDLLSYQHRRAVGMGGSRRRPSWADGCVLCEVCNREVEGAAQAEALAHGWKVPRSCSRPQDVPVYDVGLDRWFLLAVDGPTRMPVPLPEVRERMRAVYGEAA